MACTVLQQAGKSPRGVRPSSSRLDFLGDCDCRLPRLASLPWPRPSDPAPSPASAPPPSPQGAGEASLACGRPLQEAQARSTNLTSQHNWFALLGKGGIH
ncbi:mCG17922, isoform CRA_a [Mus musculus]|nr:mCG17922, isoform CRA_a [Mus musculus]EDL14954.1 mCG17922, isoform CRA_a [Mus musculus]EDL14955.1 mCG17922, isoform CRA_a [Mus musculus]